MTPEELLDRLGSAELSLVCVLAMPTHGILAPFPNRDVPRGTLLCGLSAYRRMSAAVRAVDEMIARVFR